jgi:hypothetical protein
MSNKNAATVRGERIFQVFLVLLGAAIALISTAIPEYRHRTERRLQAANMIRGSVERELNMCRGLSTLLERDRRNSFDGQYFVGSFQWAHGDEVLLAQVADLGDLEYEVVEAFNIYFVDLKQCQSFRDCLVEALKVSGFKPSQTEKEMTAYLVALKAVSGAGNELLKRLDRYYPRSS